MKMDFCDVIEVIIQKIRFLFFNSCCCSESAEVIGEIWREVDKVESTVLETEDENA